MTTHTSRAQKIGRLKRQIARLEWQCQVYARHGKSRELADANAMIRELRIEWLKTKYEQCAWQAKRKQAGR